MRLPSILNVVCAVAGVLSGCVVHPEPPPGAVIAGVRDLGPLQFDDSVRCRDGGYSGGWRGASFWLFGDTVTTRPGTDGSNWRSNTVSVLTNPQGAPGKWHFRDYTDDSGVSREVLPLLPDEAAYNRRHFSQQLPEKQRSRYATWPGPLIAAPDDSRAWVFYTLLRCGSDGPWDFHALGMSVACWNDPAQPPERPPLLFPAGDIQLGHGALAVDGMLYAYGCRQEGFSWPMLLGRVPFDRAADRGAWTFFCGNGEWSEDASRAVPVMDAAPILSVHYNRHLACYLAIYSLPLQNRLALRTAPAPEGPWSAPLVIAETLKPEADTDAPWSYAGCGHGELARENGRIEFVSYYRTTGFFLGEIRLLELTLERPGAPVTAPGASQNRP